MTTTITRGVAGSLLTNSVATYYTCPTNQRAKINQATVYNTSANARTVTVYIVPTGGSAGDASKVIPTMTVGAGETIPLYELLGHYLTAGDTIQALSDAASAVGFMASLIETTE